MCKISVRSNRGHEKFLPYKSWNTIYIMQEQNMNWFATVLIVVICFLILTDLMEALLSFV